VSICQEGFKIDIIQKDNNEKQHYMSNVDVSNVLRPQARRRQWIGNVVRVGRSV
jgi:hypothetical protein